MTDTARWEMLADDLTIPADQLVRTVMTMDDPPTALLAGNNRVTIGALRVLRDLDDDGRTALVGFDDFDTADVLGVSVISYDPVELGRRAAQVALERIGDPAGFTRQIALPTWIIERGTGERNAAQERERMTAGIVQLEAAGVGLVIDARATGLPRVLHWGEALGSLSDDALERLADGVSRQSAPGTLDAAWQLSVIPQEGDGWTGRPGLQVRRDGVLHHCRWRLEGITRETTADGATCVITRGGRGIRSAARTVDRHRDGRSRVGRGRARRVGRRDGRAVRGGLARADPAGAPRARRISRPSTAGGRGRSDP